MLIPLQSFRITELEWACSSAGRASALQVSRLNHISAASDVAYADPRGATTLSNWTDVGPKRRDGPLHTIKSLIVREVWLAAGRED